MGDGCALHIGNAQGELTFRIDWLRSHCASRERRRMNLLEPRTNLKDQESGTEKHLPASISSLLCPLKGLPSRLLAILRSTLGQHRAPVKPRCPPKQTNRGTGLWQLSPSLWMWKHCHGRQGAKNIQICGLRSYVNSTHICKIISNIMHTDDMIFFF